MPATNHSQAEANKVLRVLEGKPLKFTVRVHLPDGQKIEFQCDQKPTVKYHDELREPWLFESEYKGTSIMRWVEGAILLVEENPKA